MKLSYQYKSWEDLFLMTDYCATTFPYEWEIAIDGCKSMYQNKWKQYLSDNSGLDGAIRNFGERIEDRRVDFTIPDGEAVLFHLKWG